MRQVFSLKPDQVRVREILNKSFLEIEIWAISNAEPNNNYSCFTVGSMQKALPGFTNKPILGFFNKDQDFEQHNAKVSYDPELDQEYWDTTNGEQILGFIRESDQKEIVEKDGLTWIRCTAMICTQYNYKQVKRLLKDRRKKVSVEVEILESETKGDIEYIYDFDLLGITILGSKGGIPIHEGIEGAHLSVLDLIETQSYQNQKQALVFAYNKLNDQEVGTLAKEDIGTEGALKVNKSKEAMSDTEWGEVDKTALRNRVVAASNFKTVAKDVFLDLREGWEDGETSKLKYPVMQLKDGDELVYNRSGLASAKGYAEKNNDEEVLKKVNAIYEHLGLDSEKDKYDCSEFCDLYDDDPEEKRDDDVDDKEPECPCGDDEGKPDHSHGDDGEGHGEGHPHEETHSDDKIQTEGDNTMEDENQVVDTACDFQKQCDELRMKCEEYEAKCEEYEARCAEYQSTIETQSCELEKCKDYDDVKKALEAANTELETLRCAQREKCKEEQLSYVDALAQKMGLNSEEIKEVTEKCNTYQFASNADIEKEIGFIYLQKTLAAQVESAKHFSSNIVETSIPVAKKAPKEQEDVRTRLKKNINKGE